jgi:hypothetical protein
MTTLKFVLDHKKRVFLYLDKIEVSFDDLVETILLIKYPSIIEVVHEKQFDNLMYLYALIFDYFGGI